MSDKNDRHVFYLLQTTIHILSSNDESSPIGSFSTKDSSLVAAVIRILTQHPQFGLIPLQLGTNPIARNLSCVVRVYQRLCKRGDNGVVGRSIVRHQQVTLIIPVLAKEAISIVVPDAFAVSFTAMKQGKAVTIGTLGKSATLKVLR